MGGLFKSFISLTSYTQITLIEPAATDILIQVKQFDHRHPDGEGKVAVSS